MIDIEETESDFESAELQSKENIKDLWTSEEQFRLLNTYFKEVGTEPLLTQKEEIELSEKIKRYEARAREIKTLLSKLSKEGIVKRNGKEKRLKRMKRLDALIKAYSERAKGLKERFMKANLRLVISMARKYVGRGLPLADLIQEGNVGLIKAIEGFDHTKGYKFSTYAVHWILRSIIRALHEQKRTIKVPVYVLEKANGVNRISSMLQKEMGREPTPEEIAEKSESRVGVVKRILESRSDVVRLDTPIMNGEKTTLLEFIPDRELAAPDTIIANGELTQRMTKALTLLTHREQEVIKMRFGIGCEIEYTLDEIGKHFGLTRERIRQIEKEGFKKLATSEMGEELMSFLE
jgi:RNA polymerase sigma factor (sigma-70 family)